MSDFPMAELRPASTHDSPVSVRLFASTDRIHVFIPETVYEAKGTCARASTVRLSDLVAFLRDHGPPPQPTPALLRALAVWFRQHGDPARTVSISMPRSRPLRLSDVLDAAADGLEVIPLTPETP